MLFLMTLCGALAFAVTALSVVAAALHARCRSLEQQVDGRRGERAAGTQSANVVKNESGQGQ